MSKKETALEKAKRYGSELNSGYYCKNGVMVPVDGERRAYCEGFIGEVQSHLISSDKNAPISLRQRQSGSQAAASLLRKEYYSRKKTDEQKVVNRVNERQKKRNDRFENAVKNAVDKRLSEMNKK